MAAFMTSVKSLGTDRARPIATLLFCLALLAQGTVAWRFWGITWDDSAITLGFAQTFAQTGRIAPTPGSEIVEGYSTTLWMLLMSLAAKIVSHPAALLAVAKVSTLLLNLANLVLMQRWLRSWLGPTVACLVAGVFGCCFMFYETINGMETPLLLFLLLAMLLARLRKTPGARIAYLTLGAAFLLIRFEAAWLLIPFVLLERAKKDRIRSSLIWFVFFLAENAVRAWYFGSFIPNTIVAKRQIPYTYGTPIRLLWHHVSQVYLIAGACWFLALVSAAYLVSRPFGSSHRMLRQRFHDLWISCWQFRFTLVFLFFSIVLTIGIGSNWGPPLRSFFPGWPFLLALLMLPLAQEYKLGNGRTFMLSVSAICLFALIRVGYEFRDMMAPDAPVYMPNTTVANIRHMSDVLQSVQAAIGRQDLLYAGPDMGAVQLYSNGIRVLDLGLLCDKTLARQGYGAVESYVLQERRPGVIEVHGIWTGLTGFGRYKKFLDNYQPVVVEGMKIYLRRDLLSLIAPDRLTKKLFVNGRYLGESTDSTMHGTDDTALNRQFGSYLILR